LRTGGQLEVIPDISVLTEPGQIIVVVGGALEKIFDHVINRYREFSLYRAVNFINRSFFNGT
jgi:hypothetical protein